MLLRLMAGATLAVGLLAAERAEAAIITRAFSFEATFAASDTPFLPVNPMRFALRVTYDDSVLMGSGDPQTSPVVLSSNFAITYTTYYYVPDSDSLGFYVYSDAVPNIAEFAIVNGDAISSVPIFTMDFNYIGDAPISYSFIPTSLVVNAVPLPASLGLFGAGLIGLAAVRGGHAGRRRLAAA